MCFGDLSSHIILSAGDDGLCKVWDRRTMSTLAQYGDSKPVGVFAGHRDGITFVDSRNDDRYILTNSKDQTIKIWDLRKFASNEAIELTRKAVGRQIWNYQTQARPFEITYSNFAGDCSLATIRGHTVLQTLIRARFSPEHTGHRFVYTGCASGNVVVLDLLTNDFTIFPGHEAIVRDTVWSPAENEIVSTSWDGGTYFWQYDDELDLNDEQFQDTIESLHTNRIYMRNLSPKPLHIKGCHQKSKSDTDTASLTSENPDADRFQSYASAVKRKKMRIAR